MDRISRDGSPYAGPDEAYVDSGPMLSDQVTRESRITGVRRRQQRVDVPASAVVQRLDWSAVVASVASGVAVTLMLALLGVATGLIAGDATADGDQLAGILGGVGAWLVIAMLVGTFVGSFVGGRFSPWLDRASVFYSAITSWGLAVLIGALLFTLISIGFANAAATAADAAATAAVPTTAGAAGTNAVAADPNGTTAKKAVATNQADGTGAEKAADATGNALGGAGWILGLGLLASLAASVAGWWFGSRKPLTRIELEDDVERVHT